MTTRYFRDDRIDGLTARIDDAASDPETLWYLADHLGSIRKIVDNTSNVVSTIVYDVFGNIVSESAPAYRGRYAWTGREIETEIGLQYNRARYYDPAIGRWISKDPMGFDAGDSNLYRYVTNAPTNEVDPSGLETAGVDIGPYLKKSLNAVEAAYDKLSLRDKFNLGYYMNTLYGSAIGWDITELFGLEDPAKQQIFKDTASKSGGNRYVTVNGESHVGGAVNYVFYGKLMKLLNNTAASTKFVLINQPGFRNPGRVEFLLGAGSWEEQRKQGNVYVHPYFFYEEKDAKAKIELYRNIYKAYGMTGELGTAERIAWFEAGWNDDFSRASSVKLNAKGIEPSCVLFNGTLHFKAGPWPEADSTTLYDRQRVRPKGWIMDLNPPN